MPPSRLEGIFPPAWKKGDSWRIEYLAWERGGVQRAHRGSFRVVSLAGHDHGFHILDFRHDDSPESPIWVTFRAEDFSVASIQDPQGTRAYEAVPFIQELRSPVFAIPLRAPGLVDPFYFHLEQDENHQTRDGWQLFLPQGGDALTIQLVSRKRYDDDSTRVILEWRRGEPWYSSARCYRSGGADTILDKVLSETLTCAVSLIRPTDRASDQRRQ